MRPNSSVPSGFEETLQEEGKTSAVALGALAILSYLGINLLVHGPSPELARPLLVLAGAAVLIVLVAVSRRWTNRRTAARGSRKEGNLVYGSLPCAALETVSAGRVFSRAADHDVTAMR